MSQQWNYRLLEGQDGYVSIREVFYDSNDNIESIGAEPVMVIANDEEELLTNLALMMDSMKEPAIKEGDFTSDSEDLDFIFIPDENESQKYH